MRQRAISSAVLVPLLLVVVALGGSVLAGAVAVIVAIAAVELFGLFKSAGYSPFTALGTAMALVVVFDAVVPAVLEGSGLLLAGVGMILIAVASFTKLEPRDGLQTWITTVVGALYVSLLSFVLRLGHAAPAVPAGAPFSALGSERGWILLLILAVWAFDTGAYLVGRRFGRRRFLTHISPSKTVEGVIGGVVAATVVVAIMLWGLGQNPLHAVALGPLAALAAQAGDLAESLIKRAADAKDSGNLIPGHGGMLDRVDSFVFAAPVVTLYVLAFVR
jgi:phosphatidate cytidylyltransferase